MREGAAVLGAAVKGDFSGAVEKFKAVDWAFFIPVSYTHLRAHETVLDLVCRLLLETKQHSTC